MPNRLNQTAWMIAPLLALSVALPLSAQETREHPVGNVKIEVSSIAGGLEHPWSLAFLPDGGLLVTERAGRLRVIEPGADGRLQLRPDPVAGVPSVLASGQAGLFDILLDPEIGIVSLGDGVVPAASYD